MAEYFTKDGDDYVKVEDPLHTQADLDKIVKDRAERIARQQFGDYEDLKTKAGKVDTITSDFETKLKGEADLRTAAEKERDAAKLDVTKVKLTHEFKLSDDLAGFMNGSTEDELREQAEKLSKGIKGSAVKIDKKDKPEGGKTSDTRKIAKGLFGGKSD